MAYKIKTGGKDHFDSRFAVGGYVRGQTADGATLLYGADGAYEGMGGFVPSFVYLYGRGGLTMTGIGDHKTTGFNVKARGGLGGRRWTAGTQRVVLKTDSYSTGTSTVTTTTFIDVPFVPFVTEKAYYVGAELMHLSGQVAKKDSAGKVIGKTDMDQVLLVSLGSHNGASTDWHIDVGQDWGSRYSNAYVSANIDVNYCLNGPDGVLGLGAALELDVHWKYFNFRFDLGGNSAIGGYMALALGPALNMNPRGHLLPIEDGFLDEDDAVADTPDSGPASQPPPGGIPGQPVPAPAPATPAPAAPAPSAPGPTSAAPAPAPAPVPPPPAPAPKGA